MKKLSAIIVFFAVVFSSCQKNELEEIELVDPEVLTNPAFTTSELYAYHAGKSSALELMNGELNIDPNVITDPSRIASVVINVNGNSTPATKINNYKYTFSKRVSPFITYEITAVIYDSHGGTIKSPSYFRVYIPRTP